MTEASKQPMADVKASSTKHNVWGARCITQHMNPSTICLITTEMDQN